MTRRPPFEPMNYAVELASTGNYAYADNHIIHWTGTHWAQMNQEDAQRDALRWVVDNSAAIVSDASAASAVRTAMLWLPRLPDPTTTDLLIPLRNGYLRQRAGSYALEPHDKSLGVRYLINCIYDPMHPRPDLFMGFIERILPDEAVRSRVQEYLGYTLMQDARFQRATFWVGDGANGKGTLARIVQALHRQVASVRLDQLSNFDLDGLPAASLIYCDEAPKTGIGESIMKTLIAGETASIKRKFKDTISAPVHGKWLMLANDLPRIKDKSDGFWRRMDIVPFTVQVPEAERDPLLDQKVIKEELPGVLNWLLDGLARLLARGRFDPVKPAAMRALDIDAKASSNPIRTWVDEREVRLGLPGSTSKVCVYDAYANWATNNGYKAENAGDFWDGLKKVLGSIEETRAFRYGQRLRMCNVVV